MKRVCAAGALVLLGVLALLLLRPKPEGTGPGEDAVPIAPSAPAAGTAGLPGRVLLEAPFFPQAPTARWQDPRQQDGCEEASLLMAHLWITGQSMTAEQAEEEIIALSEFQARRDGGFVDRSVADTCALFADYYGHEAFIRRDIGAEDIKAALAQGKLVIVPANGRILDNPNYTPPGPVTHMLVITGYDDEAGQFITNDPGTRNGRGFVFGYERLIAAIYDYPTGRHAAYRPTGTAIMIVGK